MINSNKYRIKETIYRDGHKQYVAQERKTILFFIKYWRPIMTEYMCDGYTLVPFYCTYNTYEKCRNKLKEYLEKKEKLKNSNKIVMVNYLAV